MCVCVLSLSLSLALRLPLHISTYFATMSHKPFQASTFGEASSDLKKALRIYTSVRVPEVFLASLDCRSCFSSESLVAMEKATPCALSGHGPSSLKSS